MFSDSVEEQLSIQYNQVVGVKIGAPNFTCVLGKKQSNTQRKRTSQAVVKMQRTCIQRCAENTFGEQLSMKSTEKTLHQQPADHPEKGIYREV